VDFCGRHTAELGMIFLRGRIDEDPVRGMQHSGEDWSHHKMPFVIGKRIQRLSMGSKEELWLRRLSAQDAQIRRGASPRDTFYKIVVMLLEVQRNAPQAGIGAAG